MSSARVYGTVGFKKRNIITARNGFKIGDKVSWFPSRTARHLDSGKLFTTVSVPAIVLGFGTLGKLMLDVTLPDGSKRKVTTPDDNVQLMK